jgi:glucokinase
VEISRTTIQERLPPADEPGSRTEAVSLMASSSAPVQHFIAADVGGTNARIGVVRANADGAIEVLAYRKYSCGDYPSLTVILAEFVAEHAAAAGIDRMAIASAGVVLDDEVINSNLPWRISLSEMRRELRLRELHVINDFAAAAHGAQCLDPAESRLLTPGVTVADPGPVLVIGPGTGLGAAICIPDPRGTVVLPTEAGMTAFAPGNEREIAILRWLQQRTRHVSTEQLVSGPGLVNLYDALCAIHGHEPALRAPAAITEAARRGDAIAREAVLAFCALLGSVIGDLAVIGSARAVFVAGGIVPQLLDFLASSDFHARLVDKGAMRAVLERVPVRLIENERLGVIGAANWFVQHLNHRQDAGPSSKDAGHSSA